MSHKIEKRTRIHARIRSRMSGTVARPRLSVFKSAQHIYAQLIDDDKAKILISVHDKDLKKTKGETKSDVAKQVGKLIAKEAIENKIEKVVFDRGGTLFHGRIKALAEGAREGGLQF